MAYLDPWLRLSPAKIEKGKGRVVSRSLPVSVLVEVFLPYGSSQPSYSPRAAALSRYSPSPIMFGLMWRRGWGRRSRVWRNRYGDNRGYRCFWKLIDLWKIGNFSQCYKCLMTENSWWIWPSIENWSSYSNDLQIHDSSWDFSKPSNFLRANNSQTFISLQSWLSRKNEMWEHWRQISSKRKKKDLTVRSEIVGGGRMWKKRLAWLRKGNRRDARECD